MGGMTIFHPNFQLQTTALLDFEGLPFPFVFIGNTSQLKKDWSTLIKMYKIESSFKVSRNAVVSSRIDRSEIHSQASKKICQLLALDYCCLNFVLPPECNHSGVTCEWKN